MNTEVLEAVPAQPAPPEGPPPDIEAAPAEDESVAGVFVMKVKDENGNITTDAILQGVEPTEVQTLLELAVLVWRNKIGLPN